MIVSFIDGRVRIRHEEIKKSFAANTIKNELLSDKGIKEVSVNQRIGSILILYDSSLINIKGIIKKISSYLNFKEDTDDSLGKTSNDKKINSKNKTLRNQRKLINNSMLVSLTLSIIGAIFHNMGLHINAGLIFMLFSGIHMMRNKYILLT